MVVCVAARGPLLLDDVLRGLVANGYKARSDHPHFYLFRKVRSDYRFRETEAWMDHSGKSLAVPPRRLLSGINVEKFWGELG